MSVVWLLGASGDIGRAISLQLAKEGYSIAVCYFTNKKRAEEIVASCFRLGGFAKSFYLNVRDISSINSAYKEILTTLGEPSIFIYAVGNLHFKLFQDISLEEYNQVLALHLNGLFLTLQKIVPLFLKKKAGKIIVLSSVFGEVGGACETIYSLAKGGQNSMVKALAKELAPSNITVNALSIGAIKSKMLDSQLSIKEQDDLCKNIPLQRLGYPFEVAKAVSYLCTASYVTGQILRLDGGWF